MTPGFSIIVVTHDSAPELTGLIASIHRHLGHLSPQLIVVDTGSVDASAEVARRGGAELVELSDNPGFGAANNVGLERAAEPVSVLLNPDIELLDDGLLALVALALAGQTLVVPRLLGADGRPQKTAHARPGTLAAFGFALLGPALPPWLRVHAEPWRSETRVRVGWAIAAALVAQSSLLRSLGPFDPRAFLFYEDLDLCLRAAQRGIPTILEPAVCLRHRGSHSTTPAFGGEPHELMAARRRLIVGRDQGRVALALDDAAQALTFLTRSAARLAILRSPARPRDQLAALRSARRAMRHPWRRPRRQARSHSRR